MQMFFLLSLLVNTERLTKAIYAASTETVPVRLREKVRPAKKFTGTNQLASREERVTKKSLPTRWSHYIRYKQRRCSNSRLLLRC